PAVLRIYGPGMKLWIGLLSAASLATVSCGKHDAGKSGSVAISGSGSTFQKEFQEVAIDAFTKAHANVKITYGGGGSGKGRQDLADMVVDFAGTDAPYKNADKAKLKGGDVLYFPILLGPI